MTSEGAQATAIAVPALVNEALFAEAAEQLAENRRRVRARRTGARHLLQGLVVCQRCGYAFSGVNVGYPLPSGEKRRYRYYRCGGRQRIDDEGQKVCQAADFRAEAVEEVVWQDVRELLADPARVAQEYERRLGGGTGEAEAGEAESLARRITGVKRRLAD